VIPQPAELAALVALFLQSNSQEREKTLSQRAYTKDILASQDISQMILIPLTTLCTSDKNLRRRLMRRVSEHVSGVVSSGGCLMEPKGVANTHCSNHLCIIVITYCAAALHNNAAKLQ